MVTSEEATVLGLPSLRDLELVMRNSVIQENQAQINSMRNIRNMLPDQLNCTGSFTSEYHVLKPDNYPVIYAPRKCFTLMRNEIKTECDEVMEEGIIRRVSEPTEWVNSQVYVCKSNSLNLEPNDLNRAIMRGYHKTPTMEELVNKLWCYVVFQTEC